MALLITRDQPPAGQMLEAEIRRVGTHALVILVGEIDVSTAGQLYEEFARLVREGVCHVSLNMAEVSFIDSSGLSVLISEHKRMESMNGELIIFSPSHQMRRLLELTALDSFLNVRPRHAPVELKSDR
jgi:anti-sigma B factor antagonist